MIRFFLLAVTALNLSCARKYNSKIVPDENSGQSFVGPQRIAVSPADSGQCLAGGKVYSLYTDQNSNGAFDELDVLLDEQIVCNGVDGSNGADGISVIFATAPASAGQCSAGGSTIVMALDSDKSNSLTAADQNHQSVTICNGTNGSDGQDGENAPTPAFSPVEAIHACGNSVAYKEVLLRLSNGQVLGSFSDNVSGSMTRLAFLPDGAFMNTDNSGCTFSLATSEDGHTRSISWSGYVQMSWPYNP